MKRRAFITLLGGAAATWPLAARAQQRERMRRIGVLTALPSDDPEGMARIGAFLQELQQLGWTDGRNVRIDYRWGADDTERVRAERIRKYVMELVGLAPDVVLVNGASGLRPLQEATRTVPIVFVQITDPVGGGFIDSLTAGGLISYGSDSIDAYRRAASYVDRILRGEKPADLPVQAPTKYELVINLKTAKALGLEVPPTLIARADEVFE